MHWSRISFLCALLGATLAMKQQLPQAFHPKLYATSSVIYEQPSELDLNVAAFPNPSPWPKPSRQGLNMTNIVFWQHAVQNLRLVTPSRFHPDDHIQTHNDLFVHFSRFPLSKFTAVTDVAPAQQAVTSAPVPFSGVQYTDRGELGLFLNTTGAPERLTTTTIESSFGKCLPLWKDGANPNPNPNPNRNPNPNAILYGRMVRRSIFPWTSAAPLPKSVPAKTDSHAPYTRAFPSTFSHRIDTMSSPSPWP